MNDEFAAGKGLWIIGPQGSGKTILAHRIAQKHGPFNVIDGPRVHSELDLGRALQDEPNTLIVEEMPNDEGMEALKMIIANQTVTCTLVGRDQVRVNSPNVIICTGSPDPIPEIKQADRRFLVIDLGNYPA